MLIILVLKNILFIGSFLSATTGTKGPSECLANLIGAWVKCKLVSNKRNRFIRLFDIIANLFFTKTALIHVDIFSGKAFYITWVTQKLASWRKIRLLGTLHGGKLVEYVDKHEHKVVSTLSRFDSLQSPSKFIADRFSSLLGRTVHYVPNGIDIEQFSYVSHQVSEPLAFLWVRAFTQIYNPLLPLRIVRQLLDDGIKVHLTMVGPDKGMLKECYQYINEMQLESYVTITGPIPNDQLPNYYHTHHIFLNTTQYESFGVAVMEAAACGIPIVSTEVGELPYLWKDGVNILFADSTEEAFAQEIKRLLEDQNLYQSISNNARKKAEQFDWGELKDKWLEILNNV